MTASVDRAAALIVWKLAHDQSPVILGGAPWWREAVYRRVEELLWPEESTE